MALDNHGAVPLEVEANLEGLDVLGGLVREGHVVQKQSGLEQGVLEYLRCW